MDRRKGGEAVLVTALGFIGGKAIETWQTSEGFCLGEPQATMRAAEYREPAYDMLEADFGTQPNRTPLSVRLWRPASRLHSV